MDIDAQVARDSTASDIWWMGVRRLVVANGPNIFQMLLVVITQPGVRHSVYLFTVVQVAVLYSWRSPSSFQHFSTSATPPLWSSLSGSWLARLDSTPRTRSSAGSTRPSRSTEPASRASSADWWSDLSAPNALWVFPRDAVYRVDAGSDCCVLFVVVKSDVAGYIVSTAVDDFAGTPVYWKPLVSVARISFGVQIWGPLLF